MGTIMGQRIWAGLTATSASSAGCGVVYKITPGGTYTELYSFCTQSELGSGWDCPHGAFPEAGLVQGADGNFYGTTYSGGSNVCGIAEDLECGTIFKITPSGVLTTLYSFCTVAPCRDGSYPSAGLVLSADGNFYGVTTKGGHQTGAGDPGEGTFFKITPGGVLTTLHDFCDQANCADGSNPIAGLIQGADGNFYGTTEFGGATSTDCLTVTSTQGGCGTVFKITPSGTLTTLYSFCSQANCQDGAYPVTGLVQAANGYIYGSTSNGGVRGMLYCIPGCGTLFGITPAGALTTLYRFCSQTDCTDGYSPSAPMLATDGGLYGTTEFGGINQTTCYVGPNSINSTCGTIFRFDRTTGGLATEYNFCSQTYCVDGGQPLGGLFQATNGHIYGTTTLFGAYAPGTLFSLSGGALSRSFVETQTTLGSVGAAVNILGNSLTGSTEVTFNGIAATFEVVSATEITTTVPAGATTGYVEVTTLAGKVLKSNTKFTVERKTATPVFSLKAGTYTGAQIVSITDGTTGATVYYTTDGSAPATSSTALVYESPLTVSSNETLNAVALGPDDVMSAVKTAVYTID
jgi:uncharacterized protein (TIGR03437 family)